MLRNPTYNLRLTTYNLRLTTYNLNPNTSKYCTNCHYPLPDYGKYCSNCGQKFTDGRIPLGTLVWDFIDSVLNLDSKFFRTIVAIFVPGKLTIDYFKGRHRRYASPARLFFVTAVLHFATLGLILGPILEKEFRDNDISQEHDAFARLVVQNLRQNKDSVALEFKGRDRETALIAMDTLLQRYKFNRDDSLHFSSIDILSGRLNKQVVAYKDMYTLPLDTLVARNKVESFWDRLIFKQIIKVNKEVRNLPNFVIGKLIWMVILMMPALAVILKLLYIRRKRYFVEHLIFSFHYHAFAFLVFSIIMLIFYFGGEGNENMESYILGLILPMVILLYLFIAMKRVYQQGFIKTFFKYSFLNFSY